jgi:hypothetical protein
MAAPHDSNYDVSNNSKPIARYQQTGEPTSDSPYDDPGDDRFKHRKSPSMKDTKTELAHEPSETE